MVEFKQLRYFIAIAESSSFSKAAQNLFISQPALSQQISKLESQLGVTLIERNTRSVQLTPAGKDLYNRSIPLMRDMENMMQSVKAAEASGFVDQRLRIALEDGLFSLDGTGAFEFLAALRSTYPEYTVDCFPASAGTIPRMLSDGTADLGIAYNSGPSSPSPNLAERCFHRGRLALAVPAAWYFPVDSQAFYSAVNRSTLYFPLERSYWHGIINSYFAKSEYYPHNVSLENYETAVNFTMNGDGIFFAPEVQLRRRVMPGIRIIPITDPLAEYRVSVFYTRCNHSPAIHRILELLPKPEQAAEATAMDIPTE